MHCDEIWVRDTVNTNFMEGVLLIVSTGFAPGSIYGLTLQYSTSTSMAISLYRMCLLGSSTYRFHGSAH